MAVLMLDYDTRTVDGEWLHCCYPIMDDSFESGIQTGVRLVNGIQNLRQAKIVNYESGEIVRSIK